MSNHRPKYVSFDCPDTVTNSQIDDATSHVVGGAPATMAKTAPLALKQTIRTE